MRKRDNYMVACFGCSGFIARAGGCSIMTCNTQGCTIQICAFCISGASTSTTKCDINTCSQQISSRKAPPKPRQCACEEKKEALPS